MAEEVRGGGGGRGDEVGGGGGGGVDTFQGQDLHYIDNRLTFP